MSNFNPRPPCGGRPPCGRRRPPSCPFQSTSSVWRTTLAAVEKELAKLFQSTSSVWRTTYPPTDIRAKRGISIHALRVEDDAAKPTPGERSDDFNPRPPCGGRPTNSANYGGVTLFQSTSSVWRTTGTAWAGSPTRRNFNPRPPCGGRPFAGVVARRGLQISIHDLRVEDDPVGMR